MPEIHSFNHDDSLTIITQYLTGQTFKTKIPDWALDLDIPGIKIIDESLLQIDEKEKELVLERKDLDDSKNELMNYKKLIYSNGFELENIIEICLKKLGATIKEEKYGNEEYVMIHKDNEYLIEAKGKEKSIKLVDVRQLLDHILDAENKTDQSFKGILFGNSWRNHPLDERGTEENIEFIDMVIDRAVKNDIALVSCKDFFNQICKFLDGDKTGEKILDEIVKAEGIVNFN